MFDPFQRKIKILDKNDLLDEDLDPLLDGVLSQFKLDVIGNADERTFLNSLLDRLKLDVFVVETCDCKSFELVNRSEAV
jgi:hypothetical protein